MSETDDPRQSYFDSLADGWDEMYDTERVLPLLRQGLEALGVGPAERILDLGCGTGILLGTLLERLGPEGRVEAVDLSPRMVARASDKFPDERVLFHVADAVEPPVLDAAFDRVICFSAWPHFRAPDRVIAAIRRVLAPGGRAHVWHVDSRSVIDHIHRHAGEAVRHDLLEPAGVLAERFERQGLRVTEQQDDEHGYLVSVVKEDAP